MKLRGLSQKLTVKICSYKTNYHEISWLILSPYKVHQGVHIYSLNFIYMGEIRNRQLCLF